jgi:hypothetical protein
VGSEDSTVVVEFPVDAGEGVRTLDEVGMWEQLGLAAFLQRHWADNQVTTHTAHTSMLVGGLRVPTSD